MNQTRNILMLVTIAGTFSGFSQDLEAQQIYIGSTPADFQYPRTVRVGGVYPSRTVINDATRGGVMEYTHRGNGYVYSPGSSTQTVISSGLSIFPSTTIVQSNERPVIIDSQPIRNEAFPMLRGSGSAISNRSPKYEPLKIKLIYPKNATEPMSYALNGTVYKIKPGYAQTFDEDREWTIEFLRAGTRTPPVRYALKAGTYNFVADENGWDLKQFQLVDNDIPPPPLPPAPAPAPIPGLE